MAWGLIIPDRADGVAPFCRCSCRAGRVLRRWRPAARC